MRLGEFHVLIGVNLLREGLDLPEVSLVAIIDADKEGFLRNERSLVQTVGRAARNVNGMVIMYADKITKSMQKTIDETTRRRTIQEEYNKEHGMIPTALNKANKKNFNSEIEPEIDVNNPYSSNASISLAAESTVEYLDLDQLQKSVKYTQKQMEKAAKDLDFIEAARLRDDLKILKKKLKKQLEE